MLKKYRIRPSKGLGQNFLIDRGVIGKVIRTAELEPEDIVLEIGPGLGTLTQELAKSVKKVVAVEKDPRMTEILRETLKSCKNVEIIQGDILKIFNFQLSIIDYKVVANLPFYLTAPVIRKFLESENPPKEMVLIVQKEVGQRICPPQLQLRRAGAKPKMNLLAISVWFYAKPKIVSYVSKKSFWPQPKVDSAILRIAPLINADRKLIHADLFFKIVKAGFSQPRKQLINNLSRGLKIERETVENWLLKNNIQPTQRAETLHLEDWIELTKSCKNFKIR